MSDNGAKSLSELPADGQTFEELFRGINHAGDKPDVPNFSRPNTSAGFVPRANAPPVQPMASRSNLSKMADRRPAGGGNQKLPGSSTDTDTWWLDVQSPTDEEMKILSKVCSIALTTLMDRSLAFRFSRFTR